LDTRTNDAKAFGSIGFSPATLTSFLYDETS
jgi:hypothetical protein